MLKVSLPLTSEQAKQKSDLSNHVKIVFIKYQGVAITFRLLVRQLLQLLPSGKLKLTFIPALASINRAFHPYTTVAVGSNSSPPIVCIYLYPAPHLSYT